MIPWEDPFPPPPGAKAKKGKSGASEEGADFGGGLSVLLDGLKTLGPLLLEGLKVLFSGFLTGLKALWWVLTLLFRETYKVCKHFHRENQGHMSSVISQLLIVGLFAFVFGYALGELR